MMFKIHYEPENRTPRTMDLDFNIKEIKALAVMINNRRIEVRKCGVFSRILLNVFRGLNKAADFWEWQKYGESDPMEYHCRMMELDLAAQKIILKRVLF